MKNKRLNLNRLHRKGTVLVLTLLIVTLMTVATLSAATNSYSIISDSTSYNDAQVAREAALAGVADLDKKLSAAKTAGTKFEDTMLINFDTGVETKLDQGDNPKKAPYIKYYKFTPQEKIKTISRCTNVAAISAWDASLGSYTGPSDVFTGAADSISKSNLLTDNGFKAFVNPLTDIDAEGKNVYEEGETNFWRAYMGGPYDQGEGGVGDVWTPADKSGERYQGIFSKSKYSTYDLLVLTLPSGGLVLDDNTRDRLESLIKSGGKLMIDVSGSSLGIVNAPFKDRDDDDEKVDNDKYGMQWEAVEKKDDSNTRGVKYQDYNLDKAESRNDVWVSQNAFNKNPATETLAWDKPALSGQVNYTDEYVVRQIYKDMNPRVVTYPVEQFSSVSAKSLDKAFINENKVYFSYGSPSSFGVGDRIKFMYIRATAFTGDPHPTTNKSILVSGVVDQVGEDFVHIDTDTLKCSVGISENWSSRTRLWVVDRIENRILTGETYDITKNSSGADNLGFSVAFVSSGEFFTNKNPTNDYDIISSLNFNNLKSIWGDSGGASKSISPGIINNLDVDDVRGYTTGSIVMVEPMSNENEPVWGRVTGITYGAGITGTLTATLKSGPTPRSGHSLIYDNNLQKVYLFGGKDISNRFINGNMSSYATFDSVKGNDSIEMRISASARNDLWEFTVLNSTWKLLRPGNTANDPLPRFNSLVTLDPTIPNNPNLIVAGGTLGDSVASDDDNGLSHVMRTADVWKINLPAGALWISVIDRPKVDMSDLPGLGTQFRQEVYAHKSFSFSNVKRDMLSNDRDWLIVESASNYPGYPAGITIGDTISIYSQQDVDGKRVDLTGTVTNIVSTFDAVSSKYEKKLEFNPSLAGNLSQDDLNANLTVTKLESCDSVKVGLSPNGNGARCLSPGDVVTYYGENTVANQSDSQDRVYWGRVGAVSGSDPAQIKSFKQLYEGPFYMYNPRGYFTNGTLFVYGGYDFARKKWALWRLDNVNTAPEWRLVKPTFGATNQWNITYNLSVELNSYADSLPVILSSGVDNVITSGTVQELKIDHGSVKNIVVGMQYFIRPKDGTGRVKGIVQGITEQNQGGVLVRYVKFTTPLTTDGGSDIPTNNGLIMERDFDFNVISVPYNRNIDFANFTFNDLSAPVSITTNNADDVKGLYPGMELALSVSSNGQTLNKVTSVTIEDIIFNNGNYQIIFRSKQSYDQRSDSANLFTTNNSDQLYQIKSYKDNSQLWVGFLDGAKENIDWKYVKIAPNTTQPQARSGASVHYKNIGGLNYVFMWGGGPEYHYLWKIRPDVNNSVSWDAIKNNPSNIIGTNRPFGLSDSQAVNVGNDLLFFSGEYKYSYSRQNRDTSTILISDDLGEDTWVDQVVKTTDSSDRSSVDFSHPVFSSLSDRTGQRDVFKLDDAGKGKQEILKFGSGGFPVTQLGSEFKKLVSYPCAAQKGETNDPNDAVDNNYCSLTSMALSRPGAKGGMIFMMTNSNRNDTIGKQIKALDAMDNALDGWNTTEDNIKILYTNYENDPSDQNKDNLINLFDEPLTSGGKDWFDQITTAYYNLTFSTPEGDLILNTMENWCIYLESVVGRSNVKLKDEKWQFIKGLKPGKMDSMRGAAFYMNLIAYSQTLEKIKVTGYYGGVARAFLVSYYNEGKIVSVDEVPAEE